ncbi:transcriptional regulator [Microbacterium sp. SGAir0570]|uniref:LysR family substrate-binding domain-containing protein n=1 Tax=Microbacterium sp. SGAir0570 TaxID=2070348 RepID=UPI0010CCD519|nr:LysR family substrate-binding domain-containing protein [Microbacterium sp. SGAir0570]QCR41485.1 transcriptional regulator [Microbacterium sp. SGAir0570]
MTPGRSSGRPARSGGRGGRAPGRRGAAASGQRPAARRTDRTSGSRRETDAAAPDLSALGAFRLGAAPGATPGKWIDVWKQRMPGNPLDLVTVGFADQAAALAGGDVDAALVRLPIDRDGLSVIPLYDETTVAVCSVDSALTAADELTLADLTGEVVMVPGDDALDLEVPGADAPAFAQLSTTEDAVATAATGVGIVLVPMSLARLHHRKDATYRPVVDAPTSTVALAWRAEATTPLVETFIGIVRGRTANSSR